MDLKWYRDRLTNRDKHHYKQWHAMRGKYIVYWRDQFGGVEIPAGLHALVRSLTPDGREMLDMVWRYKVFRTRRSAFAACEDHAEGRDPQAEYKKRKADAKRRKPRRKKKTPEMAIIKAILETTTPNNEPKKPRKQRADKGQKRGAKQTSVAQDLHLVKTRKPRSDAGQKRGPRKPKETL